MNPSVTEFELDAAFTGSPALVEGFASQARRMIAGGADLVIPAEGVINAVLVRNACPAVDGVPVLDFYGALLSFAEMLVRPVSGVLYRTDFGCALRALADDRAVAMALGIRPRLLSPLAFALATALAGLTGALMTPILTLSPHIGDPVLTIAFAVVIPEASAALLTQLTRSSLPSSSASSNPIRAFISAVRRERLHCSFLFS
jgi:ABC-type branched-subunit amino acid transport system permease subunit